MKYTAHINVNPLKELLDPQGKAVTESLHSLGLQHINNVRIGKHITLAVDAENEDEAHQKVEEACKKLLSNPVMEYYEIQILAS